jgi:hypothetical protein
LQARIALSVFCPIEPHHDLRVVFQRLDADDGTDANCAYRTRARRVAA